MFSIVVPAYNEEKAIAETIRVLRDFFRHQNPDFELVVVSDGSTDSTYEVAKGLEDGQVRVVSYFENRGKGHALKYGFEQSRGDPVVFFDSGLNFPPQQILDFLERLENNRQGKELGELPVDLVIGSKRHPESVVDYPLPRKVISFLAQVLVKVLFNLEVTDTQVGLKVFRRSVLEKIMPLVLVKRYAFDIELLVLAHHFDFRIIEAPVELKLKFSTAATPKSIWRCLRDALAVFYRLKILRFYDQSEEEQRRLIEEYPATWQDRLVCFIFGDIWGRARR